MPNPYHDADGKFCSRNEMQAAIDTAGRTGDFATFSRLKDDLNTIDAASPEEIFASFVKKEPTLAYVTGPNARPASRIHDSFADISGHSVYKTFDQLGKLDEHNREVFIDGETYSFVADEEKRNSFDEKSRDVIFKNGDGYYRTSFAYSAWDEKYTDSNQDLEQVEYGPVEVSTYVQNNAEQAKLSARQISMMSDWGVWYDLGNKEVGKAFISNGNTYKIVEISESSSFYGVTFSVNGDENLYLVQFPMDSWDDGQYEEHYAVQARAKKTTTQNGWKTIEEEN